MGGLSIAVAGAESTEEQRVDDGEQINWKRGGRLGEKLWREMEDRRDAEAGLAVHQMALADRGQGLLRNTGSGGREK